MVSPHHPARKPVESPPLEAILERTAERIIERGTRSEPVTLRAMAAATCHLCPGAAAALVDRAGSEVARLRAFGIVHGVVLRSLSDLERSRLRAQLAPSPDHLVVCDAGRGDDVRGRSPVPRLRAVPGVREVLAPTHPGATMHSQRGDHGRPS
jgi:hypothetical protein